MELNFAHRRVLEAIKKINGKPTTVAEIGEVAGLKDWTSKKAVQELRDAGYLGLAQTRRNAPGVWSVIREWRL